MAWTPTGVKITRRFLCKDKRDIKRACRLIRLNREGKLSERGKLALRRLMHKHEHRYGDGWRTRTPEENKRRAEHLVETRKVLDEAKKEWGDLERDVKALAQKIGV